jgi:DNA-binding FrmR family transcriptional regulator
MTVRTIERGDVRSRYPSGTGSKGGSRPVLYTPLGYSAFDVATQGGTLMYGYTMNKKAVSDRLRRIEGQVRGIQRMVDENQYCIDILTQVNSAASALKSVGMGLLDDHVRHCVKESFETGDSDEKVEELLAAVARFAGK